MENYTILYDLDKIYCLGMSDEGVLQEQINEDSLVLVGKNWNRYYLECSSENCEIIENVLIIKNHKKEIATSSFIDYDNEEDIYLISK